jgi:hypothetical protein
MKAKLAAALAVVALLAAACNNSKDKSADKAAGATKEVDSAVALSMKAPADLKVGMIVSNAGPGKDVAELAGGAYVAE